MASPYAQHVTRQKEIHDQALAAAGLSGVAIHAGALRIRFQDDSPYPFAPNPNFLAWLPLDHHPDSWVVYASGETPRAIYVQPDDYWHLPPADPEGEWVDEFEVTVVKSAEEAQAALPPNRRDMAFIGEDETLGRELGFGQVNPPAVLLPIHYRRAYKTDYEVECLAEANRIAARAHRAAEQAFRAGASEFEIHMAYLRAAELNDPELPYSSIVALNEHGAVLHYQALDRAAPADARSFLIDAGARYRGYCSDITRTYARDAGEFADLITAMDERQRQLADSCVPGKDFKALHLAAHRHVAELLSEFGLVKATADEAYETGLSRLFLPHGLGHLLGIQVHDVGGFQAGPDGGEIDKPEGHPFLRLTRVLEPGMVTTIEPGLYIIPAILNPIRDEPQGRKINWDKVDALAPYGGVRIEDDVLVTEDQPRNLSREAFAELD